MKAGASPAATLMGRPLASDVAAGLAPAFRDPPTPAFRNSPCLPTFHDPQSLLSVTH